MERFGAVFARNCRCHAIMRDATMIASRLNLISS